MNPAGRALEDLVNPALFVFRYFKTPMNAEAKMRITSYINNTSQMRNAEDFIRFKTDDVSFTAGIIIIAEWRGLRFECCVAVSLNRTYMYYGMFYLHLLMLCTACEYFC